MVYPTWLALTYLYSVQRPGACVPSKFSFLSVARGVIQRLALHDSVVCSGQADLVV